MLCYAMLCYAMLTDSSCKQRGRAHAWRLVFGKKGAFMKRIFSYFPLLSPAFSSLDYPLRHTRYDCV